MLRGGSQSTFQGEAQGPLGGGAGALFPSRRGMEEEAGEGESEGEGERKQGCEIQGEAWGEATKVSAKITDAKMHGSVSDAAPRTDNPHLTCLQKKQESLSSHLFVCNHTGKILFRTLELKS